MATNPSFHYEIEKSEIDKSEALDSRGTEVTTFKLHGKLVAENRAQLEEMFKNTPFQGRIVIDLGDISYVDSAGLGALIRLKMSAIAHGGVSVEFVHMTARVMQLLKITNLSEWFSS
jgi:anti-anti-sigma factor